MSTSAQEPERERPESEPEPEEPETMPEEEGGGVTPPDPGTLPEEPDVITPERNARGRRGVARRR